MSQYTIVVKNKELKFNIVSMKSHFQYERSPQSGESEELQAWGQNICVQRRGNCIRHFIAV